MRGDDIVYLRRHFESLSGDVWLVHTDHSQPRQLTNLTLEQIGAHSEWPVWKPDRRAIAFASDFRDAYNLAAWNIFTVDLTGTGSKGVTQLTSLPLPDGNFFPRPERTMPGIRTWLQVTPQPGGRITGRVLQDGQPVGRRDDHQRRRADLHDYPGGRHLCAEQCACRGVAGSRRAR